jgi:hypothetical protein
MLGFRFNPTSIASRYIALLVELRGLIDCGAVIIVETGPSPMSGYAPQVTVYREADPPGVGTYQFRGGPYALSDAQFARIQQRVGAQLAERAEASLASQYPEGDITAGFRYAPASPVSWGTSRSATTRTTSRARRSYISPKLRRIRDRILFSS